MNIPEFRDAIDHHDYESINKNSETQGHIIEAFKGVFLAYLKAATIRDDKNTKDLAATNEKFRKLLETFH